jgi:hypothetical protein
LRIHADGVESASIRLLQGIVGIRCQPSLWYTSKGSSLSSYVQTVFQVCLRLEFLEIGPPAGQAFFVDGSNSLENLINDLECERRKVSLATTQENVA